MFLPIPSKKGQNLKKGHCQLNVVITVNGITLVNPNILETG